MKDRFKFRAWIKSEKRYGYLLNLFNCGANSKKYEVEEYDEQGDYYTVYSSDEVVLQQCTGLKDKNGKLIFEGDIIKDLCIDYICTVVWKKAEFALKSEYGSYVGFNTPEQEVIGNIYENPELLEVKYD